MDFLNKAYSQLTETLKPMSMASRITTVLLLVVVVVGIAYLFQYQPLGGDQYLLGAQVFSREELAAAVAAFADAQLNDFTVDNNRIRVPAAKRYQYIAAMSQAKAMPETSSQLWGEMFNSSILESREVRHWRNQYRKKRDLERVLSNMTGVKQASVEFDVEQTSSLMGQPKKSALIAITPSRSRALDGQMISSVRDTAADWLNMEPDDVGVLDMFSNRTYRGDSKGHFAGGQDDYSAYKSIRENQLTSKLNDQLSYIPGAIINVQIELEPEVRHQTTSVKYNDKPTTVRSTTETDEQTTSKGRGGRPGTATNNDPSGFANSAASVAGMQTETTRNVSSEEQESIVGREHVTSEKLPFSPKDVTVSILIPRSHVRKIWLEENPPAEGEEPTPPDPTQIQASEEKMIQDIEEIVNNLLPRIDSGADPFPRVSIKYYHDLKTTPIEGPSQTALITEWLQDNMTSIGMAMLGVIGLVFLRGMIKSAQTDGNADASSIDRQGVDHAAELAAAAEAEGEDSDLAKNLRERFQSQDGPDLRAELADMVREDPDAAASVLSVWIGDEAAST